MKSILSPKIETERLILRRYNESDSVNTVNKKHNYCNVGYVVRYNYWGK